MPSAPRHPAERPTTFRAPSRREYESYDSYEVIEFTVPAGTTFVEAGRFSGIADRIRTRNSAGTLEWRFREEGQPPGGAMRVLGDQWEDHHVRARIVEVRDPAGVGGQTALAEGLFGSRAIDVRRHEGGPRRAVTEASRELIGTDPLATG